MGHSPAGQKPAHSGVENNLDTLRLLSVLGVILLTLGVEWPGIRVGTR